MAVLRFATQDLLIAAATAIFMLITIYDSQ